MLFILRAACAPGNSACAITLATYIFFNHKQYSKGINWRERRVNIPQEIGIKHHDFGLFLLEDENQQRVKVIARGYRNKDKEVLTVDHRQRQASCHLEDSHEGFTMNSS